MNQFRTSIVPTLSVRNGAAAIAFYMKAFNAVEPMRIDSPDGFVVAELSIDGVSFFLADESPEHGNLSPQTAAGVTERMGLFVANPVPLQRKQ